MRVVFILNDAYDPLERKSRCPVAGFIHLLMIGRASGGIEKDIFLLLCFVFLVMLRIYSISSVLRKS